MFEEIYFKTSRSFERNEHLSNVHLPFKSMNLFRNFVPLSETYFSSYSFQAGVVTVLLSYTVFCCYTNFFFKSYYPFNWVLLAFGKISVGDYLSCIRQFCWTFLSIRKDFLSITLGFSRHIVISFANFNKRDSSFNNNYTTSCCMFYCSHDESKASLSCSRCQWQYFLYFATMM